MTNQNVIIKRMINTDDIFEYSPLFQSFLERSIIFIVPIIDAIAIMINNKSRIVIYTQKL